MVFNDAMQFLITGATGTVGRQVVSQLHEEGAAVRAMTRDPEKARLPKGVEVVRGDLTVPAELDRCLEGVDAVFLVWTARFDAVPAAIDTIARRAKRLVLLTSPHQTPHPFFQQPNFLATMHAKTEELIRASGLPWTFLRPGMFAANAISWWAPQIRAGDVVRWPYGDAPTAPVHERDIAAVAVRALLDAKHDGREYVLTGPRSLTQREQVATIGDVIGKPLRFEELTPDQARRELGFPPAAMDMLLTAWAAAIGQPAYVTNTIAEVTGRSARPFSEFVMDHAEEFRCLVRTC